MGSPAAQVDSGRNIAEGEADITPGLSSVDKSELFQVNGLNTTMTSPVPQSVFEKKKEPEKPKLLTNTLIKSIKVGGRSRMILRDSSLGQVAQKLNEMVK